MRAERLDRLGAKLDSTDDSSDEDIDQELMAINDSGFITFEEMVKEDDRAAKALDQARKQNRQRSRKDIDNEDPINREEDDVQARLLKKLEEYEAREKEREAQAARQALIEKFESDERLKGVPKTWIRNNLPETEEDFEEKLTGLVEEFDSFAKEHKINAFRNDAPVAGARKTEGSVTQATREESDALAKKLLVNLR